jgi:hypothetical protein
MAQQMQHLVQSFTAGRGASLKADKPIACKTADDAKRKAERMADSKVGVVAYSMTGDADTGDYDETPMILFRAGKLPMQFED